MEQKDNQEKKNSIPICSPLGIVTLISTIICVVLLIFVIVVYSYKTINSTTELNINYHNLTVGVKRGDAGRIYYLDLDNGKEIDSFLYTGKSKPVVFSETYYSKNEQSVLYRMNTGDFPTLKYYGVSDEWENDDSMTYNYKETFEYSLMQALKIIKISDSKRVKSNGNESLFHISSISYPEELFLAAKNSIQYDDETEYKTIDTWAIIKNDGDISKIFFNINAGESESEGGSIKIFWYFDDINNTDVEKYLNSEL